LIIIQVSPEANAESVRRMLAQAQSQQVVLDLPDGWSELNNMARMRLLQRQAQLLRMHVALATRHEPTRLAAKQAGVPVFYRAEEAERKRWQMTPTFMRVDPRNPHTGLPDAPSWQRDKLIDRITRQRPTKERLRKIEEAKAFRAGRSPWLRWVGNAIMVGLIAFFLAGFTLFVLPAATITLVPGQERITVSVPLTADPSLDEPDYAVNKIPARLIEKNIDIKGTLATSGVSAKATDKAVGTVTFRNLGGNEVRIPNGTVVGTSTGSAITFTTRGEVTLSGGQGSTVDANIEAVEPGLDGNVLPNTINTVSGALRFRVRVTNDNSTFGGGGRFVSVVTQADRDALLEETRVEAEAKAYETLSEQLEPGEWLAPESVNTFVIAQVFSEFNDEESDELNLTLRVLAQGTAVSDVEITEAAQQALQEQIPNRGQLVADSIVLERNANVAAADRAVDFGITAMADFVIPIDPSDVRTMIAGLTPDAAAAAIQERWLLAEPPEIYRDPEVLAVLPAIERRIQVRIDYQGREPEN